MDRDEGGGVDRDEGGGVDRDERSSSIPQLVAVKVG